MKVVNSALILLLLGSGWNVFCFLVARHSADNQLDLKKAIEWNPLEPDYHFRNGLAKRDLPVSQNLTEAEESLLQATQLNPFYWQHWIELARCYELAGNRVDSESAYQKAIDLNPRSGEFSWRFANSQLRWGERKKALEFFQKALGWDLSFRKQSLFLLTQSGYSIQEIRSIWPYDPASRLSLLHFFVNRPMDLVEEYETAQCWNELLESSSPPTVAQGSFYIYYLLQNRPEDARTEWIKLTRKNRLIDIDYQNGRNLAWNGQFEEKISNGPLGWYILSNDESSISRVSGEGLEGSTALRIDFAGSENPDFHALGLRLLISPADFLTFSFQARSHGVTTDEGLYFRLTEESSGATLLESRKIHGTTPWTKYVEQIPAPRNTAPVRLELRRDPSLKIDNRLSGTVWIDSVKIAAS
jgi:tetratricopeptide (TPR) repeat protein